MARNSTSWAPGQSGNPAGRPAGSSRVAPLIQLLDQCIEPVVRAVVDRAQDGDTGAAKLLLDRYWAPQRILGPGVVSGLSPSEMGACVVERAVSGNLSLEEAQAVHKLVTDQARLVSLQDLARRVEALEAGEHAR